MVAKPPECLLKVQSTSVIRGVWGVVDYGLGVVVGLMGEWWPVCAQVGPLGGGVDGVSGLGRRGWASDAA